MVAATSARRILVMGIGNILMKDEGVGCRVAEEMASRFITPAGVDIIDSGTMGMSILNLFREYDFMVVVDAIQGTFHPPGTVVRLSPEDIAPNQVRHSLHDTRFIDVLEAAELMDCRPDAECVGIQIEDMHPAELTIGLSESVEGAVEVAIGAVLAVLRERGIELDEKDQFPSM